MAVALLLKHDQCRCYQIETEGPTGNKRSDILFNQTLYRTIQAGNQRLDTCLLEDDPVSR